MTDKTGMNDASIDGGMNPTLRGVFSAQGPVRPCREARQGRFSDFTFGTCVGLLLGGAMLLSGCVSTRLDTVADQARLDAFAALVESRVPADAADRPTYDALIAVWQEDIASRADVRQAK